LIPILTRLLEPSDYGLVAVFAAIFNITNTTTMFGLRAVVLRAFTVEDKQAHADYLASNFAIVVSLTIVAVCLCALGRAPLYSITNLPLLWALVAVISGSAMTVFQIFLTVLQARRQAVLYAIFQNSITMANIGISLLLVVGLKAGWQGRVVGAAVAALMGAGYCLIRLYRGGELGRVRRVYVADAAALGGASVPHAVANALLANADRFFLSASAGVGLVGIYTIGSQFASVMMIAGSALGTAVTPWIFERLSVVRSRADLRRPLKIIVLLCVVSLIGAIAFYLLSQIALPILVSKKYIAAMEFFPWLLAGGFFNSIYFFFAPVIFYYKKTKMLSLSGVFILIAGLALMFGFSSVLGPVGVAIAMCSSRFLLCAITFVLAFALLRSDVRFLERG
jgi:PST family polysaccharide transporter